MTLLTGMRPISQITGCGTCSVGVSVPESVGVSSREPLISDIRAMKGKAYAKFTGSVLKNGRGHVKRRRQGKSLKR